MGKKGINELELRPKNYQKPSHKPMSFYWIWRLGYLHLKILKSDNQIKEVWVKGTLALIQVVAADIALFQMSTPGEKNYKKKSIDWASLHDIIWVATFKVPWLVVLLHSLCRSQPWYCLNANLLGVFGVTVFQSHLYCPKLQMLMGSFASRGDHVPWTVINTFHSLKNGHQFTNISLTLKGL